MLVSALYWGSWLAGRRLLHPAAVSQGQTSSVLSFIDDAIMVFQHLPGHIGAAAYLATTTKSVLESDVSKVLAIGAILLILLSFLLLAIIWVCVIPCAVAVIFLSTGVFVNAPVQSVLFIRARARRLGGYMSFDNQFDTNIDDASF
ncbi:hypothetical protein J8273_8403 [Carpediemonas membranifera]|uniref:Uncharacterized protein n=1 Tax=Carpediemonas membranifera TaxID=201153 RepID=A0A8J6AZJ8_9EUKA|nr:hypothetical protein J8273_8403 [Carpediemonas membranifera]|eukprot:KAG9389729.1 hypothetical protein J8273_8403 [Carpediemonas membranifera]